MRRRLWSAAIGLCVILPVLAHEEKDPVCGMMVDTDSTPADQIVEYAGKKYFFCVKSEADQFRADPEKYVTLARLEVVSEGYKYTLDVSPRTLVEGDLATLTLNVPPAIQKRLQKLGEGDPLRLPLAQYFYFSSDRLSEHDRGRMLFHASERAGQYSAHRLFSWPGECRLVVDVAFPDTTRHRLLFRLIVVPRPPDAAPPAAPSLDPKTGLLSMEAQHDTMAHMGDNWVGLEDALRRGEIDWADASSRLSQVRGVTGNLQHFKLHKFEEDIGEFRLHAGNLEKELAGLAALLEKRDRSAALSRVDDVDANQCTKCHLKFRWGSVLDLTRFPDLKTE